MLSQTSSTDPSRGGSGGGGGGGGGGGEYWAAYDAAPAHSRHTWKLN